jgi:hypothetical protein
MLVLETLPPVIGTAAVAPALLILWLVVAAGERPGPPSRVWGAFLLGAASVLLLVVVRAPILLVLPAPENPWMAQAMRSLFGVALPEETVKLLVIIAVSSRRRPFVDPMDTVVYGAAAGLGFAAYENLAYLVQHADIWQSLAPSASSPAPIWRSRAPGRRWALTVTIATGRVFPAASWCWPRRSRCTPLSIFLCSRCKNTPILPRPRVFCWVPRAC